MNAYEEGMAVINSHRRMPLTPREKYVLKKLAANEKLDLTWAKGGGCYWLGDEKVGASTVKRLLLKVYISTVYESNTHDYEIYTVNEDGRRVAATLGAPVEVDDDEEDE